MSILKDHINQYFDTFLEKNDIVFFEKVFEKIKSKNKETYKGVLQYLFMLIGESINNDNNLLIPLNIHFEANISSSAKTLLAEFLWQYFFENCQSCEKTDTINYLLKNRIDELQNSTSKDLIMPYLGPTMTNDEKRKVKEKSKNIIEKRVLEKNHLLYYKYLKDNVSLSPKTLINLKVNKEKDVAELFKYTPTYLSVDELGEINSYVLINTKGFNDIRGVMLNDIPLLRIIENVVLFDCENSIQRFLPFNFQQLNNLNQNHGTRFKLLLLITFSNKGNLNALQTKISRLKERYHIPNESSYVVTKYEVDTLTNIKSKNAAKITFFGSKYLTFWDDFLLECKINELYELRSIKMMNVYSLCYNEQIKQYILEHIFSSTTNSQLITEDSKSDILDLPDEDLASLRTSLSYVLEKIIHENLKNTVCDSHDFNYKIVLDGFILKNDSFFSLVKNALNVQSQRKFVDWEELEEVNAEKILILSYRDQGNFNNHFYPNINELLTREDTEVKFVLPALFFDQTYNWSKYNLAKEYFKALDHPIRKSHFEWDKLKTKIQELKPEKRLDISWDLESDYSGSDSRITYRVLFENNGHNTCNPSDLMIYFEKSNKVKRIQPIKWIYENLEVDENRFFVQKLDELIDEFNPAEKLIDTAQQESDLEILRNQFELGDENAGRLWKILLARKVYCSTIDVVYDELKSLFLRNNLNIVSRNYFESTWIDPESESLVPRGNKTFKVLCNYLGLPTAYLRIMYTIKNRTKNGKRNATRIYSRLLKDLFNDGCFDYEAIPNQIFIQRIDYYKNQHNLDELGIDEEKPVEGLVTLVELLKPEINNLLFRKVSSIQKREE
jgi:hypothetical protein